DTPWVDYRQHETNALGANRGFLPALQRFQHLYNGTYRAEILKIAETIGPIAATSEHSAISRVHELLREGGLNSRPKLLGSPPQGRRRPRDRWILGALIAAGVIQAGEAERR